MTRFLKLNSKYTPRETKGNNVNTALLATYAYIKELIIASDD